MDRTAAFAPIRGTARRPHGRMAREPKNTNPPIDV